MKKRMLAVGFALTFFLGVCLLRISYLTSDGTPMQQAAQEQSTLGLTVSRARGTIYDRNGTPLVNGQTETRAVICPTEEMLLALKPLLSADLLSGVEARLQEDTPMVLTLSDWLPPIRGMEQFTVPVRYGASQLAPHVVGYVDSSGENGITGIEYACDEILRASSGRLSVSYSVNGLGTVTNLTPTVYSDLKNAEAGVMLTLDAPLQQLAESVSTMTRGAVVITDPTSGDILAMVSAPSFQPTSLTNALSAAGSPLLNRAITDYNCGSVFKIVTAAAALEAGIPIDRTYTCNGYAEVEGTRYHCHHRLGHGTLTMAEAFEVSCNPYFVQLAQEVGAARLYDMATAIGFSRAIRLSENWQTARAILPELTDLVGSSAQLANLSFGQGGLLATPVHLAALVGAVVNDGLYVPPAVMKGTVSATKHLTESPRATPTTVFSKKTAGILRQMMESVVTSGTGQSAAPDRGTAAAKTGTAETGWYEDGNEVVQSWVVGYYPAESPRYVISVLVENSAVSGENAAPIFKALCDELYFYDLEH